MDYKRIIVLLSVFFIISCSSDDAETQTPAEDLTKLVTKKIFTNPNGDKNELKFTYNQDNNLVRIDAENYYKTYAYSGENITKIESIDLPNSPYYTIDFSYDASGKVTHTKRTNHYDNTLMIVQYEYANELVTGCCIYNSQDLFDLSDCRNRYAMRYVAGTTNYVEKDRFLTINLTESLIETTKWKFDDKEKPFFGKAIEKINLPYATSGVELDWEYVYNTNNPLEREVTDDMGVTSLSRTFEYIYDAEDAPMQMVIKNYDNGGNLINTIQNDFEYVKR